LKQGEERKSNQEEFFVNKEKKCENREGKILAEAKNSFKRQA
jgi:hypothetical protein